MTERSSVDSFFLREGVDTSHPNWQIKSLSEEGLHGFIVDANQRMGVINRERVEGFLVSYFGDSPKNDLVSKYVPEVDFYTHLDSIDQQMNIALNVPEEASNIGDEDFAWMEIFQSMTIVGLSDWYARSKEGLSPVQIATCETFISQATSFNWDEDQKKFARLTDDVNILNSAYQEMKKYDPKFKDLPKPPKLLQGL